jgi:hypothetical protein
MLHLSVSVSVLVQTKPKFWYFGFGLKSGFGRSLEFSQSVLTKYTFKRFLGSLILKKEEI